MSRHGYNNDDYDDYLAMGRWRAVIQSASRGKRGQQFFLDLIQALDALPEKKLCKGSLETPEGSVCALGAVGRYRGVNLDIGAVDEDDDWQDGEWSELGSRLNIAEQLAQETMYMNDEHEQKVGDWYLGTGYGPLEDPDIARWKAIRRWAVKQLTPETLLALS